MKSVRSMAWKLLKANRFLIASPVISIVLSIVLVATMFVYGIGAWQALEQSLKDLYGEADLLVSYSPEDPYVLTGETISRLTALEEIESAAEVLHATLPPDDDEGERAKGLMVKLVEGADAFAVAKQMKEIDARLSIDLREEQETDVSGIRSLQAFLAVLSVLVLAVSTLLVLSHFEILLYKLRHQIAILRSLGATARQIGAIVRHQSLVITGSGTGLGALVSYFGTDALFRFAERVFHLPSAEGQVPGYAVVGIAFICGVVFQLFLLIPARRSTRILPVKLAEDVERLDFKGGKKAGRTGRWALLSGIFLYAAGYVFEKYAVLLAGLLLAFIGSLLVVPAVVEMLLKGWHRRIGRRWGRYVYLAVKTMLPQTRKNAFSMLSVALVLIIAVFGSTLLSTLNANHHRYLHDLYEEAPIYLYNRLPHSSLDPHQLREEMLRLPSIRDVTFYSGYESYEIMTDDDDVPLLTFAAAHSPLTEGLRDNELVLSAKLAANLHLQPGDEVSVGIFDIDLQKVLPLSDYRVAGISHELGGSDEALVPWSSPLRTASFRRMFVATDNEEQAMAELGPLLAKHPQLQVRTYSRDLELARDGFLQRWAIFIAVLIVLVAVTMAGVLHGFVNQMLARRKDYAVLRAVGVTPKGIVGMILSQAGFSLGGGILVGVAAGAMLIVLVMLLDPTPIVFDVPVIGMTSLALSLLVMATLAWSGRRLSRENLTRELTMDGK